MATNSKAATAEEAGNALGKIIGVILILTTPLWMTMCAQHHDVYSDHSQVYGGVDITPSQMATAIGTGYHHHEHHRPR